MTSGHPYFSDEQAKIVLELIWRNRDEVDRRLTAEDGFVDLLARMLRVVQYECGDYDPVYELSGFEEIYGDILPQ